MRIRRTTVLTVGMAAAAAWVFTPAQAEQMRGGADMSKGMPADMSKGMPMPMHDMAGMSGMNPMTPEQKIANAMSAAPSPVSAEATILDWPAKEGATPVQIRAGRNGWTCLPDMPDTKGNDPMCMDKSWMMWVEAYLAHKPPMVRTVGIAYMMAPGGAEGSNTDPYATAAAPDNHWAHHPPHMMILVPDLKSLEGLPTDPANGGPYVMYAGTPYAHIMAPIQH